MKEFEMKDIGFKEIADYGIILESYRILEYFQEQGVKFKTISSYHLDYDWYLYDKNGVKVAVAVSQGASMAVDLAERYASSGVKYITRIGTTGALNKDLRLGEIALPIASIKDEGTSNFYIEKNAPAIANIELFRKLEEKLKQKGEKVNVGISWSTDGRWKETDKMVRRYISSGAIFADMESSALFSFGLNRRVKVASLSILSDEIQEDEGDAPKGLSDKDIWFNKVLPKMLVAFNNIVEVYENIENSKK